MKCIEGFGERVFIAERNKMGECGLDLSGAG